MFEGETLAFAEPIFGELDFPGFRDSCIFGCDFFCSPEALGWGGSTSVRVVLSTLEIGALGCVAVFTGEESGYESQFAS